MGEGEGRGGGGGGGGGGEREEEEGVITGKFQTTMPYIYGSASCHLYS